MYIMISRARKFELADTSDLLVDRGIIQFIKQFKYLGSYITPVLKDDFDIDARIKAAGATFASARKSFFASKDITPEHKGIIFTGLITFILLYGCEAWALSAAALHHLQMFYNQCVRSMCRTTRWHSQYFHLSQADLEKRIGIKSFEHYLDKRRLTWIGHVARMDWNQRLPRKLLSSWIDSERPVRRPQHSWGRSMINDLPRFGLDTTRDGWASVAQDRLKWNWIVRNVTRSDQPPASTYASVMAAAAGGIGTQVSVVIFDTANNNAAPTVICVGVQIIWKGRRVFLGQIPCNRSK